MLRATKIIATLGPASEKPEVLRDMIRAGVDVVRMNFSHGTIADHKARHDLVRAISAGVVQFHQQEQCVRIDDGDLGIALL